MNVFGNTHCLMIDRQGTRFCRLKSRWEREKATESLRRPGNKKKNRGQRSFLFNPRKKLGGKKKKRSP